jgi:hypothetical protein
MGYFDEDAATWASHRPAGQAIGDAVGSCWIMADIDPQRRGMIEANYPIVGSFDDTTTVSVSVDAGLVRKLSWDWHYSAYYEQPYNAFWVEVADQNGAVTSVIPVASTSPAAGYGWRPLTFPGPTPPFFTGNQTTNLDLSPWAGQKISVNFKLREFYDPERIAFVINGYNYPGYFDLSTAKVYVTNLRSNDCPEVINNPANPINPTASGGDIDATFTPALGLSLQDAAAVCGFVDFDWVQIVTHMDDPTAFSALNQGGAFDPAVIGPVKLGSAQVPFHDPPQGGGYTYQPGDNSYPFYYNWLPDIVANTPSELSAHEPGGSTLTFHDAPTEPCFPDGSAAFTPKCNNTAEVAGSFKAFTTHLVGIKNDGSYIDLGLGFDWWSNYSGTSGGVTVEKTDLLADGNGSGGVTIASVHTISNYRGPGTSTLVDTAPPTISILATPTTLWPPNGRLVTVTVSGTITDNPTGSGINALNTVFFVVDEYGEVQPTGTVTTANDGSYTFTLQLPASRAGEDRNGRQFAINVNASDNAGNTASATAKVTVPHDQGN